MITRRIMRCLAVLLICSPPAQVRAQTRQPDFSTLDQVVREEMKARRTPGAALVVVLGDRVVYAKGYGVTSVESGDAVTPDTLFRLGSTTKMFTAAALVTLAERGKLKLDAPLGETVPGLHPSLARVTAHQLLSQSAGLRDFASPIISQDDDALGRNVRSWKEDVFFTEPGRIYSYSSPGYWLAGFVSETVYGKPYADALEELLFKPLEMRRTTLRPLAAMTYPLAQGHNIENDQPVVVRPLYNNTAMWPGGSIFSSANDLARFVLAFLNDGKLDGKQALLPQVTAKLPARQMTMPGDDATWYGYGLMSYETRGVRLAAHGGASRGYGSTIETIPAQKYGIAVLTNKSGETLPQSRLKAMELLAALQPDKEEAPRNLPLTADELRDYAGVYSHAPQTWEVFSKDGKLFLKQERTEFALTKTGPRSFAYEQGEIVFVAGADGRTEHLFMGLYAARKQTK